MQISGKTFLVTGGSSGLGEGTARMLAAGGANVVIADMNREQGEKVAAAIGGAARFAACVAFWSRKYSETKSFCFAFREPFLLAWRVFLGLGCDISPG